MRREPAKPCPVRSIEKMEVVKTESLCGRGIGEDPMRIVTQYWDMDGKEIARIDAWQERKEGEDG